MTTAHIIETDATHEEFEELAERLRVEYPECTITLRISDAWSCPSWCTLEPNHEDWGTTDGSPVGCHQGPTFGKFSVGTEQTLDGMNPPSVVLGDFDGMELDAEQMQEFARNAMLTAEWLAENS